MHSVCQKIKLQKSRLLNATLCVLLSANAWADSYENEWENVPSEKNENANTENNNEVAAEVRSTADTAAINVDADEMEESNSKEVRRFHEVLDELLAEFGYDVRMGQLGAVKNVSIRRVDVSDALPNTYRSYVEMLVSERIRENSRVRLVTCVPCRSKTSHLVEGKLLITSPTTNMESMKTAANQLGIDNFMDVILVYHTTHMVLAMQVFNAATQEMVWTRTYNSETIRSRYQKLAVDYQQVEKARPGEEYTPEYRYLFGLGGGVVPNVNNDPEDNGMIALMARGTEKFDNRKHEFGLQLSIYLRKDAILQDHDTTEEETSAALADGDEKTTSDLTPWDYGLALYGLYGRHFVGSLESYNEIRHGISAGLGFLAASAYITASARLGWDVYFGRRFVTNLGIVALAPSTVIIKNDSVKTKAGVGGDFTISLNF